MSILQKWEDKIKEKRKKTDFRDFVKEIASWDSFVLYKNHWLISKYPETWRVKGVISSKEFNECIFDIWINKDYDFSNDFFTNFQTLLKTIDLPSLRNIWSENGDFSDTSVFSKNIYLSFTVITNCENILYSYNIKDWSKNIFNSVMVWDNCENIYMSSWIFNSSFTFYSKSIINSSKIRFSQNLIGCNECLFCNDLENKTYCINNRQYDKDTYQKEKMKMLEEKMMFTTNYTKWNQLNKNVGCENVIGSSNFYSNNIEGWIYNYHVKNWKNLVLVWLPEGNENMYDTHNAWSPYWWDMYWVMWAGGHNLYICLNNNNWMNNYYCMLLSECSFCIWCIWLRNKEYCILNKQYTKEEWYIQAEKIFSQMDDKWILWDFFPWWLNPFYFNDTVAHIIDDTFTKEEVDKDWYMWRNTEIKVDIPQWVDIIKTNDLNNYQWFDEKWNWHINPDILKKVIKDENWNVYRIVKMEYDFLVKHWLPLPELHWFDRIKLWFNIDL